MLSGDEGCAVCARRIVHPDDHLRLPLDPPLDLHRLCVPDWEGYDEALAELEAGEPTLARRRLLITLRDCREIPPVI